MKCRPQRKLPTISEHYFGLPHLDCRSIKGGHFLSSDTMIPWGASHFLDVVGLKTTSRKVLHTCFRGVSISAEILLTLVRGLRWTEPSASPSLSRCYFPRLALARGKDHIYLPHISVHIVGISLQRPYHFHYKIHMRNAYQHIHHVEMWKAFHYHFSTKLSNSTSRINNWNWE
jgi:hypothetical protein